MITSTLRFFYRTTSAALFQVKQLAEVRGAVKQIVARQAEQALVVTSQRRFYRSPNALLLVACEGRITLIHHREANSGRLRNRSILQRICAQHGWALREDRRRQLQHVLVERRGRCTMAGLVLLASSAFSALTLASEFVGFATSVHSNTTIVRAFNLFTPVPNAIFESPSVNNPIGGQLISSQLRQRYLAADHEENKNYDPKKYRRALKILHKKWVKTDFDPHSLESDMDELAVYIARHPAAYELLTSLAKKPLFLQYKAGEFRSLVKGNALAVHSVRVYFDPRSAAQLNNSAHCASEPAHCVASPADALLHELLHAKIALLETADFIRSGAMQSLFYPRAHESHVIDQERELYAAMSASDRMPRPQRHNHRGALRASACITCLGG